MITAKLWKSTYDPINHNVIRKQEKLKEGLWKQEPGHSTEAFFREFAEANRNLMPEVDLRKARFNRRECRVSGLYWNLSVLYIPGASDSYYYHVSFYS